MQLDYRLTDVRPNTPEQLDEARRLFGRFFKTVYIN